ncbi:hypothetical protein GCM10009843_32850 [Nocardioides bigeumensis]|uniref:histidine kinase n=2 Tax=Nocardioides bigeumensis TaxID=433657 RepID=A0ABP5KFX8_9ACTN
MEMSRRIAIGCGSLSLGIGVVVLIGWATRTEVLIRLDEGLADVRVNSAIYSVLIGLGVIFAACRRPTTAWCFALLACVIPALTMVQAVTGRDLHIDLLVLADVQRDLGDSLHPGRMTFGSGVTMFLLASALVWRRRWPLLAHVVAVTVSLLTLVPLVPALLNGGEMPGAQGGAGKISLTGVVIVLIAGIGVVTVIPSAGITRVLREPGSVGGLTRQAFAGAVVAPVLVGAATIGALKNDWATTTGSIGTVIAMWIASLLLLLTWLGRVAIPVERERDTSLAEVIRSRDRLALLNRAARDFGSSPDLGRTLDTVVSEVARELHAACTVQLLDVTGTQLHEAATSGTSSERDVSVDVAHADLVASGRTLGVLTVRRDSGGFDKDERGLVAALADRAAQAIHNGQMVAAQQRRDAALASFAAEALGIHDADTLRSHAVEKLCHAMEAPCGALLGADDADALVVVAASAAAARQLPRGLVVTEPLIVDVHNNGSPLVVDDLHAIGGFVTSPSTGIDSLLAVAVPMLSTGHGGVLAVLAEGIGRFSDDDVDLARAFAGLVAGAVSRIDAEQASVEYAAEREALLDRLVSAQEDERRRIADGVHQDQVQAIAAVDLRLAVIAGKAQRMVPELVVDLAFAQEAVSGAVDRLRAMLFELEPPEASAHLGAALGDAASFLLDPVGTAWSVEAPEGDLPLTDGESTMAYRIAKEALANVARHACASKATISISREEDSLRVVIEDDGVGMRQVPARSAPGHLGVSSMRDWVQAVGGHLNIESVPGRGTVVDYRLPVSAWEHPRRIAG